MVGSFKAMPSTTFHKHDVTQGRFWYRILVIGGVLLGFSGCSSGANNSAENATTSVVIAAASDLRFAFTDLGAQFEDATGIGVTFTFGSSGQLKEQIINGAPFDLFASANEQFALDVVDAGKGWPETVEPYALGRIVVMTRSGKDIPRSISGLASDDFARIAIANPTHAPYGIAAREALQTAGIYDEVKSRLVFGENVSDTLRLIETGNVDAAIVALSLVITGDVPYELIPDNVHAPLKQSIVVTKTGDNENNARKFIEFLSSENGRRVMESYGFTLPMGAR
jgi:molybdate transport system substrate-binding protein